ncbi:MAG: hypothetical protein ACJ8AI_11985 [Rhodopila sp.]
MTSSSSSISATISPHDPDEDADSLDDDALLEAYLRADAPSAGRSAEEALPDWPPLRVREVGLQIETATLDWFKANHQDWCREIHFVLKAWVAAQAAAPTPPAALNGETLSPSI